MKTGYYPELQFISSYTSCPSQIREKLSRVSLNNLRPVNGSVMSVEVQSPYPCSSLIDQCVSASRLQDVCAPPKWIILDKEVLFFDAIFEQDACPMPEIHRAKINFYLRDRTIEVLEPVVIDCSICYKILINRHRIPHPPPNNDSFYDATDFNIGNEMRFYGIVFTIINCENFSREFLEWCGISVPQPIQLDCWTPSYCPQCSHIFVEPH